MLGHKWGASVVKIKTREELGAQWWKDWWADDYSWAGLVRKQIAGIGGVHGERTLQDYWLKDPATGNMRSEHDLRVAGELVKSPDGSAWHIAHVPLVWADGSPAKSGWSNTQCALLATVISTRIAMAQEVRNFQNPSTQKGIRIDGRAQLQGSVILDSLNHPAGERRIIHVCASRTYLPAGDGTWNDYGPNAWFQNAYFNGDADFNYANFSDDTNFIGAIFFGHAFFNGAIFSGSVDFSGVLFSRSASYFGTAFRGTARFSNTIFQDEVTFEGSGFTSDARFYDILCQGKINFRSVIFCENTEFDNARFLEESDFGIADFHSRVSYQTAVFSDITRFDGAIFRDEVDFESAVFRNSASFDSYHFESELKKRRFSGRISFRKAIFAGPTSFEDAVLPREPMRHSAAFLGARFEDLVSFRGCGDHWVAALNEAEIKARILIDKRDEGECIRDFDMVVLPRARCGGGNPDANEILLKELEGGCRAIKVSMGAARDEIMEQRYYRFQLRARREQAGVPWFERQVSHLYGVTADYGLSLWRPLLGLLLLITYSTGLYIVLKTLAEGTTLDASQIGDCLLMSLSRIFPFGAFEGVSDNWIKEFLKVDEKFVREAGWSLVVRGFATLQSLIALVLVFLFGLAVRRRFKVGE